MDTAQHVAYWSRSSEEDLAAARSLREKGHLRHALFFAHLAVEKILKAHLVKNTNQIPPKIHDLLRLADLAQLDLDAGRRAILAKLQEFCLAGRYPDWRSADPPPADAETKLRETEEVCSWLQNRLSS